MLLSKSFADVDFPATVLVPRMAEKRSRCLKILVKNAENTCRKYLSTFNRNVSHEESFQPPFNFYIFVSLKKENFPGYFLQLGSTFEQVVKLKFEEKENTAMQYIAQYPDFYRR